VSRSHLETVQGTFASIAGDYHRGQAQRLTKSLWLALARPRPSDVLLDIATGTGAVLRIFREHVRVAVGIDISAEMLSVGWRELAEPAETRPLLLRGDGETLPFVDESFDLVTCSRALHHTPRPHELVAEIARVLRPGGRVVVYDNTTYEQPELAHEHNRVETIRDVSHFRTLPVTELVETLEAAGLEVESTLVDEVLRTVESWLEDAGAEPASRNRILRGIDESHAAGDRFALGHFTPGSLRYRTVWLHARAR
jgi:ubiquinone/menaquinone biosynthesis C-methylase UbiE